MSDCVSARRELQGGGVGVDEQHLHGRVVGGWLVDENRLIAEIERRHLHPLIASCDVKSDIRGTYDSHDGLNDQSKV